MSFDGPHLQPTFFAPSELKKQRIKNIKLIEFDQKSAENNARDKKILLALFRRVSSDRGDRGLTGTAL